MSLFGILICLPIIAAVALSFVFMGLFKAMPVIAVAWIIGSMIDRRRIVASSDGKGTL